MKSRPHGAQLAPLEFEDTDIPHRGGIEATERVGRRALLHYEAAVYGVDPALMVAWASTEPAPIGGM